MSQAAVHGDTIYLAGMVGAWGAVITGQTETALAEVERLLAAAGSSSVRIFAQRLGILRRDDSGSLSLLGRGSVTDDQPALSPPTSSSACLIHTVASSGALSHKPAPTQ